MKRGIAYSVARFLAMLAVTAQVLLPGTLAVAASNGVDVSRFICAPSGQLPAEAQAAIELMAELLGDEAPDHEPSDGHCPFCTLVHVIPLPERPTMAAPATFAPDRGYVRYEAGGFVRKAPELPRGSRGPPRHR